MMYFSRAKRPAGKFADRQMKREADSSVRPQQGGMLPNVSGGKLGCRSSYLSGIITGILAAR